MQPHGVEGFAWLYVVYLLHAAWHIWDNLFRLRLLNQFANLVIVSIGQMLFELEWF